MIVMRCLHCDEEFRDGIDAGHHEIETGHVVTWAFDFRASAVSSPTTIGGVPYLNGRRLKA